MNASRLASTNVDFNELTDTEEDIWTSSFQDYNKLLEENREFIAQTLQNLKNGADLTRVIFLPLNYEASFL